MTAGPSHDYALNNAIAVLLGSPKYVVMPPPDVTTGPTIHSDAAHRDLHWNLKDANGQSVPDGPYRIVVEISQKEYTERSHEIPFMLGPTGFSLMPPDADICTSMQVTLQ